MSSDEDVELSDELSGNDSGEFRASGADPGDPFVESSGDADLSGFAEEAVESSYGFDSARDTTDFRGFDEETREELIDDAHLQDSGEYTLPVDAAVEPAVLSEQAADEESDPYAFEGPTTDSGGFASEAEMPAYGGDEGYADAGYAEEEAGFSVGELLEEGAFTEEESYGAEGYAEEGFAEVEGFAEEDLSAPVAEEEPPPAPPRRAAPAAPAPEPEPSEDDKPHRPGQIAKSALDDIFARASRLKREKGDS